MPEQAKITIAEVPALIAFLLGLVGQFIVGAYFGLLSGRNVVSSGAQLLCRRLLSDATDAQANVVLPGTEHEYKQIVHSIGPATPTIAFPDGTKGLWIGKKDASRVLLYFHGGGFAIPASTSHLSFLKTVRDDMTKAGHDTAVLILTYELSSTGKYPRQLQQAAQLLAHVLDVEKVAPGKIMLAGDSAGANLCLGILSHILHPHPSIPEIKISEPFLGMALISPWISFDFSSPNFQEAKEDMITKKAQDRAVAMFLPSPASRDNYNEAGLADAAWWAGSRKVTKTICVWYGATEGLRLSIEKLIGKLSPSVDVTVFRIPNEYHIGVIMEHFLPFSSSKPTDPLRLWIKSTIASYKPT